MKGNDQLMNVVHDNEIRIISYRGRSKSWLKKGKNRRLKNTWKAGKSDETDQISTKIGNQIMK